MLSAWLALLAGSPAAWAGDIEPEVRVQAVIASAVDAVVSAGGSIETPAAVAARRELIGMAGTREELLAQLLLHLSRAEGTEASMSGALLLQSLDFTVEEKMGVARDHLDAADARQHRALYELLSTVDRPEGGTPDLDVYAPFLASRDRFARQLTSYMYAVDARQAVRVVGRVEGSATDGGEDLAGSLDRVEHLTRKRSPQVPWPESDVREGREHLSRLAASPDWWVRLYAATVVGRFPALSSPALLTALRADDSNLVRAALAPPGNGPVSSSDPVP
ncbi:MAG: hypothetical protein ACE5IK_06805 [Acidobacteriota bacterium]